MLNSPSKASSKIFQRIGSTRSRRRSALAAGSQGICTPAFRSLLFSSFSFARTSFTPAESPLSPFTTVLSTGAVRLAPLFRKAQRHCSPARQPASGKCKQTGVRALTISASSANTRRIAFAVRRQPSTSNGVATRRTSPDSEAALRSGLTIPKIGLELRRSPQCEGRPKSTNRASWRSAHDERLAPQTDIGSMWRIRERGATNSRLSCATEPRSPVVELRLLLIRRSPDRVCRRNCQLMPQVGQQLDKRSPSCLRFSKSQFRWSIR